MKFPINPMKIPFCDTHIQAFFSYYQTCQGPLDLLLGNYFKAHKSLGANDRRTIGDTVYGMVRWQSLLDWACPPPTPFLKRLAWFKSPEFDAARKNDAIPESTRSGLPEFLFDKLVADFGLEKARSIGKVLNTSAPTTIRANLLKTTREHLMQLWENDYPLAPCTRAPAGIKFVKRLPLFSFPEFKKGLFEVQDEGSQIVSGLVKASPGDSILDFCSGSGGKTLAFAPAMQGRGQIYLHDIRPSALVEAKRRLKRAGIQNAQFLPPGHSQLTRLKEKCDWVLIDVPCSGTGTLRRNPDQKWRFDQLSLQRLVAEQREIAKAALAYLKPGGRLVYATCSILSEENQGQVDHLLLAHPLALEMPPLTLLPEEGGMDGFFAAVFRKKESML